MTDSEKNISWPGWETVRLIGRGGFGSVYEIQRQVFGNIEKAALKVITLPQNASDIEELFYEGYDEKSISETFKGYLQNIISEYSLMKKLSDCENVVNCDDIRYTQHEDGIGWDIFIKMELLKPLTQHFSGNISEKEIIKLGKDICNALIYCKNNNIIHRDIKPQNIFVSTNGIYKLGDFGIAKTVEKTMGGTKIGTYKYMAPEVYNNQPYGIGADIYSLGLVMYWLLNNRRMPFVSPTDNNLTVSIEDESNARRFSGEKMPPPLNGSEQLKQIVLKACEFNPANRYSSPQAMYDALEKAEKGESAHIPHSNYGESHDSYDVKRILKITDFEAANGCKKTVTLDGRNLEVTIPRNIKNGDILRLSGVEKTDSYTGRKVLISYYLVINIIGNVKHNNSSTNDKTNISKEINYTLYLTKEEVAKGVYTSKVHYFTTKFRTNATDGEKISINYQGKNYIAKLGISDANTKDFTKMPDSMLKNKSEEKKLGCFTTIIIGFIILLASCAIGMAIPVIGFIGLFISAWMFISLFIPDKSVKAQNEIKRRTEAFKTAIGE